jgi:hypothetical protein
VQPLGYECPDESGRNAEWERLNIKAFAKNKQFKISKIMQTMLLRVVSSGEMISVKSEKSENGVLNKRILVLQELGGKYENCYVVTVLGNLATLTFEKNELVFATMRFQTREYNGQVFMDIVATDVVKK